MIPWRGGHFLFGVRAAITVIVEGQFGRLHAAISSRKPEETGIRLQFLRIIMFLRGAMTLLWGKMLQILGNQARSRGIS